MRRGSSLFDVLAGPPIKMSSNNSTHDYNLNHATIQATGPGEGEKRLFLGANRVPLAPLDAEFVVCIDSSCQGDQLWDASALEATAYGRRVTAAQPAARPRLVRVYDMVDRYRISIDCILIVYLLKFEYQPRWR